MTFRNFSLALAISCLCQLTLASPPSSAFRGFDTATRGGIDHSDMPVFSNNAGPPNLEDFGFSTPAKAPPKEKKCTKDGEDKDFLDAFPFFHDSPARYRSQKIAFLIEFSRFMNKRMPLILKDFVTEKKIYHTRGTMDSLLNMSAHLAEQEATRNKDKKEGKETEDQMEPRNFMYPAPSADISLNHSSQTAFEVTNVTNEILALGEQLLGPLGSLLTGVRDHESVKSPEYWETACKAQWWPYDGELCTQIRCTACTPVIASAGAACEMTSKPKSHRCMQRVMGEGYCNYCVVEFVQG